MKKDIRELIKEDIELIVDYFLNGTPEFLNGMGADKNKLPGRDEWMSLLKQDLKLDNTEKNFYYIIWLIDGKPIGHSNINMIRYGLEAYMHLHIWKDKLRQQGVGTYFVKMSIPFFFKNFELQNLYCEPYAYNSAPNKTLPKIGFEFERKYETTPGWINFHQSVSRYVMTKMRFNEIYS